MHARGIKKGSKNNSMIYFPHLGKEISCVFSIDRITFIFNFPENKQLNGIQQSTKQFSVLTECPISQNLGQAPSFVLYNCSPLRMEDVLKSSVLRMVHGILLSLSAVLSCLYGILDCRYSAYIVLNNNARGLYQLRKVSA